MTMRLSLEAGCLAVRMFSLNFNSMMAHLLTTCDDDPNPSCNAMAPKYLRHVAINKILPLLLAYRRSPASVFGARIAPGLIQVRSDVTNSDALRH